MGATAGGGEGGQGGAEAHGAGQQGEGGDDEAGAERSGRVAGARERPEQRRDHLGERVQEVWRDDREAGGDQLERDEQAHGIFAGLGAAMQDGGADRHAAEEPGERGEHTERLAAEREREQAGPQQLVAESGGPG